MNIKAFALLSTACLSVVSALPAYAGWVSLSTYWTNLGSRQFSWDGNSLTRQGDYAKFIVQENNYSGNTQGILTWSASAYCPQGTIRFVPKTWEPTTGPYPYLVSQLMNESPGDVIPGDVLSNLAATVCQQTANISVRNKSTTIY